jgi:hypothetical protein
MKNNAIWMSLPKKAQPPVMIHMHIKKEVGGFDGIDLA